MIYNNIDDTAPTIAPIMMGNGSIVSYSKKNSNVSNSKNTINMRKQSTSHFNYNNNGDTFDNRQSSSKKGGVGGRRSINKSIDLNNIKQ